jgi:YjbE family integral membrane protein
LLWIAVKLILDSSKNNDINVSQEKNLFGAIKTIIIADFIMSLDNSVAIAAAADGNMYLVIFGLLLSIPIIVWGSSLILKLIDKYPIIIYLGSALLGWIGGSMIQTDIFLAKLALNQAYTLLPFLGIVFVILCGLLLKNINK